MVRHARSSERSWTIEVLAICSTVRQEASHGWSTKTVEWRLILDGQRFDFARCSALHSYTFQDQLVGHRGRCRLVHERRSMDIAALILRDPKVDLRDDEPVGVAAEVNLDDQADIPLLAPDGVCPEPVAPTTGKSESEGGDQN